MSNVVSDLRSALRGLAKTPGLVAVALLTLALGLGANLALGTVLDRMLLRPLDAPGSDQITQLLPGSTLRVESDLGFSVPNYEDLAAGAQSFQAMAGLDWGTHHLAGDGPPSLVTAGHVEHRFFEVLGTPMALGRDFRAEDDRETSAPVLVLSHGAWQKRFGGRPELVGQTLMLDGTPHQVVGILPERYRPPFFDAVDLYLPIRFREKDRQARGDTFFRVLGRLKLGVKLETANAELRTLAAQLAQAYPQNNTHWTVRAEPLAGAMGKSERGPLLLLQGSVALLLLLACTNLSGLLLARGLARQREFSLRAALGARPWDILRLLMIESTLLALGGSLLGLGLSHLLVRGLHFLMPLPPHVLAPPDGRAFILALLLGALATLLCGVLPAWHLARTNLSAALREGARGSAGPWALRLRGLLAVGQVALATCLLIGAALLLRGLWVLQASPLGFEPRGVVVGRIPLAESQQDLERMDSLSRGLLDRLEGRPGIEAVALVDTPPFGGSNQTSSYEVPGQQAPPGSPFIARVHSISPGYFATLGIPLRTGRSLALAESGVCVINQAMAEHHWPGQSAVDRIVHYFGKPLRVVGVCGNTRHIRHRENEAPELYVPLPRAERRNLSVVVRSLAPLAQVQRLMKEALQDTAPDLAMGTPTPLTNRLARVLDTQRMFTRLLLIFGAGAALLAALGLHTLLSHLVGARRKEVGIRMALGATARQSIWLILRQGLSLTGFGLLLGSLGTLAAGRLLASQLEGVTAQDPVALVGGLVGLGSVALLACLIPALRASRVQPAEALRSE